MILEIAEMSVQPGREKEFTEAHVAASPEFTPADGMLSLRLTQGVEDPATFVLLVEWADLAAHERFRDTERWAKWRAAIGPYVAGPAIVRHTHVVP